MNLSNGLKKCASKYYVNFLTVNIPNASRDSPENFTLHKTLHKIAPTGIINSLCNVRGLLSDVLGNDKVIATDRVLLAPPLLIFRCVTDLIDCGSDKGGNVLRGVVGFAGNFAAEGNKVIFDLNLHCKACVGIAVQISIQQITGNIVSDFIGMTEADPFRSFTHKSSFDFLRFSCILRKCGYAAPQHGLSFRQS